MALTYTPKRMYFGQPGTGDAVVYTTPAATPGAIVKQIMVANTTASPATLSLGRNGTAATAANQFVPALSFAGNSVTTIDLSQVLDSGDTIHALQNTAGALTVWISGVE